MRVCFLDIFFECGTKWLGCTPSTGSTIQKDKRTAWQARKGQPLNLEPEDAQGCSAKSLPQQTGMMSCEYIYSRGKSFVFGVAMAESCTPSIDHLPDVLLTP